MLLKLFGWISIPWDSFSRDSRGSRSHTSRALADDDDDDDDEIL
jgi:hypothetical protein